MKKKIITISLLALSLASCGRSESISTTPLEQYTEKLLTLFPNYESNEIARNTMADSIKAHARAQIGSIPTDLSGLKFKFEEIKEGADTCVATFLATGYASIDAPSNSSNKYIIATPGIMVVGKVDKATAVTLDHHKQYSVSGKMFEYDATPWANSMVVDIPFGTYFLEALNISEIPIEP